MAAPGRVPEGVDAPQLLYEVLAELRELNERHARAEAALTKFMKSRNAKVLLGFISARAGGGRW